MLAVQSQDRVQVAPLASPGTAAQEAVGEPDPQRTLLVALDMGKDVHMVYMRTLAGREVMPPTQVPALADGYAAFHGWLDAALRSGVYDLVRVGHEPTGVYHENWSYQLAQDFQAELAGQQAPLLRYHLLNPTLVKEERKRQSHRPRKSDAIDCRAIAAVLAQGLGTPALRLDPDEWQLRHQVSQLFRLQRQQKRLGIDLLRSFDRLWPGALGNRQAYRHAHPDLPPLRHLVDSRPLTRHTLRVLLEHAPDPHVLRQYSDAELRQLFHAQGVRCGDATVQRIQAVLAQSLLPPPQVTAWLARQIQRDFAHYRRYEAQISELEAEVVRLLPHSSAQVLTSVPGVSPLLAARYLAGLGRVTRFTSAAQIWAFAGFDPSRSDSGNRRRRGAISHRGAPHLRNALYLIGYMTSHHCADCARTYVRARQRGMPVVKAVIHVAHKANRLLFALLQTQQAYRSPLSPQEEADWLKQMAKRRQRTV